MTLINCVTVTAPSTASVSEVATISLGSDVAAVIYSDGNVVIEGSGTMDDFDSGTTLFKDYVDYVVTVSFADESSVTSVGAYVFNLCTHLTSVTIPDAVTSIGSGAFYNCASLTSITIPDAVTSIGSSAFYNCASLTSITIPSGVTSIGSSTFYNCASLTSITIPDAVTSIGSGAFQNCTSLTSITIPDAVTSIDSYAFRGCTSLTSITIPDAVTSIGSNAFYNCTSLTSITIPDAVTSIGNSTFYNCTSLTSITIPDAVTSIGSYAFQYCASLTSITFNSTDAPDIGALAFSLGISSVKVACTVYGYSWISGTLESYSNSYTTFTYEVWEDSVTISGASSVTVGAVAVLTVTVLSSDANKTVTWSVSDESYATLSSAASTSTGGTVKLTGVAEGTVTVRATANGSGVYAETTVSVTALTPVYETVGNGTYTDPFTQLYIEPGSDGGNYVEEAASPKAGTYYITIGSTVTYYVHGANTSLPSISPSQTWQVTQSSTTYYYSCAVSEDSVLTSSDSSGVWTLYVV